MEVIRKIVVTIILIVTAMSAYAVDNSKSCTYLPTLYFSNEVIEKVVCMKIEDKPENLVLIQDKKEPKKQTYAVETKGGKLMLNKTPRYGNRILNSAKNMLGDSSRDIDGTRDGRLAGAAMVSEVLKEAQVPGPRTLSTNDMYEKLRICSNWRLVSIDEISPGDIIISPSDGDVHGHVGIVGDMGQIYSNDSRNGVFRINYDIKKWLKYYGDRKGLDVYVFRCIKA